MLLFGRHPLLIVHMLAAILHLLSTIVVGGLSGRPGHSWEAEIWGIRQDINASFDPPKITADMYRVGSANVSLMAVFSSAISGIAHLFVVYVWHRSSASVMSAFTAEQNQRELTRVLGVVRNARWVDYGLTAPLLFIAVAVLSGVWSAELLVTLWFMMTLVIVTGATADAPANCNPDTRVAARIVLTVFSWIIFTIVWTIVIVVLVKSSAPHWVIGIVLVLMLLFASFGVLQAVHDGLGRIFRPLLPDRVLTEGYYCVLSVTAKLSLQWMVYAGSAVRTENSNSANVYATMTVFLLFGGAAAFGVNRLLQSERHQHPYSQVVAEQAKSTLPVGTVTQRHVTQ